MDPSRISVVIPALNEGKSVGKVVQSIRDISDRLEIIVVNDGSTDETAPEAEKAGARVLSNESPQGYGAALKKGTRSSSREFVLYCDADGQHTPEDISRLVQMDESYDMVVGARNRASHAPLVRKPGKFVLRVFADYLAGQRIPDLNSGLRLVRRELILRYSHLLPDGFSYSTTSTFCMMKTRRRVHYFPIRVEKRIGKSTVRQLRHGGQTLMLMLRLTMLFDPLKVFLHLSAGLGLMALASCFFDFWLEPKAAGGLQGSGIGDSTVLLAVSTLLVFLFGLLCDQVASLRRELHER